MPKSKLGARIRKLREARGQSLSAAARDLKLTKAHLWELEMGLARNPTLKTLLALCKEYDITIQELTEGLL